MIKTLLQCFTAIQCFDSVLSFHPAALGSTTGRVIIIDCGFRRRKSTTGRSRCSSGTTSEASTSSTSSITKNFKFKSQSQFKTTPTTSALYLSNNSNYNNSSNVNDNTTKKASVSLSSTITSPSSQQLNSPTAILDYILTILTSDIGSIIIGSIGLLLALYNRLSTIDFDTSTISTTYAESINIQSRNDLLAVFASGAVLLNGISKLDVTSVLADTVVLNGYALDKPRFINQDGTRTGTDINPQQRNEFLEWALESILSSTPAKTVVLLVATNTYYNKSNWIPIAIHGIVPTEFTNNTTESKRQFLIPKEISTPILDRFIKQGSNAKESYLPTLQALPGKVEFTYLPDNTQEALLLPIIQGKGNIDNDGKIYALVMGSDTAKSFSPRDVAWCQVIAKRIGDQII